MLSRLVDKMRDIIDLKTPSAPETGAQTAAAPEAASENALRAEIAAGAAIAAAELERITADIVKGLKTVFDPEIPVDIYELGLIYKVDLADDRTLSVLMTLTAPGCPVAGEMPGWVEGALRGIEGVGDVKVDMTFDPPWSPARMSDEAKLELGYL